MKNLLENLRLNVFGSNVIGSIAIEEVDHKDYGTMEVCIPYTEMDLSKDELLSDWTVELSSDNLKKLITSSSVNSQTYSERVELYYLNSLKSYRMIISDGLQYHLITSNNRRQWINFLLDFNNWLVTNKEAAYDEIESNLINFAFMNLSDENMRDLAHEFLLDTQSFLEHELVDGILSSYREELDRLEIIIHNWTKKREWSFVEYESYLHSLGGFAVWNGDDYVAINTDELVDELLKQIENDIY